MNAQRSVQLSAVFNMSSHTCACLLHHCFKNIFQVVEKWLWCYVMLILDSNEGVRNFSLKTWRPLVAVFPVQLF